MISYSYVNLHPHQQRVPLRRIYNANVTSNTNKFTYQTDHYNTQSARVIRVGNNYHAQPFEKQIRRSYIPLESRKSISVRKYEPLNVSIAQRSY